MEQVKFENTNVSIDSGKSLESSLEERKYTTVAIIGTAGRKDDKPLMSRENYSKMVEEAERVITQVWGMKWDNVELVSGSASYADHVAVSLFLKHRNTSQVKLTLHLPCKWDYTKKAFYNSGANDWKVNPGKTSNYYHDVFSKVIGRKSLEEIDEAFKHGASCTIGKGFHDRDCKIAESEYMVAYGFHGTISPTSGGTKFTWSQSKSKNKTYVNIAKL